MPDLAQARRFAEAVQTQHPRKMLAYNCSPSFNWKKKLDTHTIARFQRELGAMGATAYGLGKTTPVRGFMQRIRAAILGSSCLAACFACGEASGPPRPNGPTPIAVNRIVEGSVASDTVEYVVRGSLATSFSVLLQVTVGEVTLQVLEPGAASVRATLSGTPNTQPFGRNTTGPIMTPSLEGQRILINGRGTFRFEVNVASSDPERITRSFSIGDTVTGEDLAPSSDVDDFVFSGRRGDELIGYVQALDAHSVGGVQLTIVGVDIGVSKTAAVSRNTDVELQSQATFRFVLPQDGEYRARITTAELIFQLPAYVGAYRFQVRRIDRRPEVASASAVFGDTLGAEAIDYVGDIDEYQFAGRVDDVYNAFIQRIAGAQPATLELEVPAVIAVSGAGHASAAVTALDSALLDRGVGRFSVTQAGNVTVRVMAATAGPARGRYRLFVHRYDDGPEATAAVITLGTSIASERINVPGTRTDTA